MERSRPVLARLLSATVALALVLTTLLSVAPPRANAAQSATLFRGEFESAPLGPVSAPLATETGQVVAQAGAVKVVTTPGGRALGLDSTSGPATALLQWSNFPSALPISTTQDLTLRISADFTTSISGTDGASFGLLSGASFFEFFSFGANGTLTRGGAPTSLTYIPTDTVRLSARIVMHGDAGQATITLYSRARYQTFTAALPAGLTRATLNQLRFQAPASSGVTSVDHVNVLLQTSAQDDDEPPAVIIIRERDIEHEIEHAGGVIFISIKILIVNTGGSSSGTFLVLDLDDLAELLDLADVSFLIGTGFVRELDGHHLIIGLGQNNVIDGGGKIQVKIKFKAKQNRLDIKINAHFRLNFNDSAGSHEVPLPPVNVGVPMEAAPTALIVQRLPLDAIDSRFSRTWNDRGGLDIFGLPLTQPITRPNGVIVQYFERARLEWHPELRGTAYEVLLGLLAVELGHSSAPTATTVPTSSAELRWYYPATGHLIGQPFRTFWSTRGGLAIFGLPIGEAVVENGMLVQYFERARMELHPELAGTRYAVQLGHLGLQALEADQGRS